MKNISALNRMSPLRYPGGKGKMYGMVERIIKENYNTKIIYVEPFAGGAEVALNLLKNGIAKKIIINDYDYAIYSFWYSILNHTSEFLNLIRTCEITYEEREKQKEIYNNPKSTILELGFATFYLNRVNRSGIINGGPISNSDNSKYPLDCRFNKKNLISRIEKINQYKNQIIITNLNAKDLIKNFNFSKENVFFFFDPPYYVKGGTLYMNAFEHDDHVELHDEIINIPGLAKYIITYDNVKPILEIYSDFDCFEYELTYTASSKKKGKEVMFVSKNCIV